jgi:hypothetical protein
MSHVYLKGLPASTAAARLLLLLLLLLYENH